MILKVGKQTVKKIKKLLDENVSESVIADILSISEETVIAVSKDEYLPSKIRASEKRKIEKLFDEGNNITEISKMVNRPYSSIAKVLEGKREVTVRKSPKDRRKEIKALLREGKSIDEISEILKLTKFRIRFLLGVIEKQPRLTKEEKETILNLYSKGINGLEISKVINRPNSTVYRFLHRIQKEE